jgi:pyruvate,orthophosphate dikinase
MGKRWIYAFGAGRTEGRNESKELLGGKGAGLAEMSALSIPVPPGFTMTTEACRYYHERGGELPSGLREEFDEQLAALEEVTGRRLGDAENPLLVSVRSGGAVSMPGMMDTVLNIGLNDELIAVRAANGWDPRFAWDCYRRLLGMYGDVVLNVPHAEFEAALTAVREEEGVATDAEISAGGLESLCGRYQQLIRDHDAAFPQDVREQLWGAVMAVFDSWNNRRAREYRRLHGLSDAAGTAVNVQTMVFGNAGDDCATGVAFTRSPADGRRAIFGEFLVNAQGEDVVAGIRTPQPILSQNGQGGLQAVFPEAFETLQQVCSTLESERRDMQDVEFTSTWWMKD